MTNAINGKRYIGYTSQSLKERWRGHVKSARLGSKLHFHLAIQKYGKDSFKHEVLFIEDSLAGAKETEILLILDRCPEYNKTMGGDGTTGHIVTDEMREKIRQTTPVRRGADHPLYGHKRPDVSERNKNTVYTKERREKCKTLGMLGKSHSEETKLKMSMSQKGKAVSEESRAKMSEAAKWRCLRDGPPKGRTKKPSLSAPER